MGVTEGSGHCVVHTHMVAHSTASVLKTPLLACYNISFLISSSDEK